ncbi:MAG: hypothetical protein LKE37_10420 [Atopobiaceae bacterium]|nr:hypothetical protein [Atopobiaceae bacterium]
MKATLKGRGSTADLSDETMVGTIEGLSKAWGSLRNTMGSSAEAAASSPRILATFWPIVAWPSSRTEGNP